MKNISTAAGVNTLTEADMESSTYPGHPLLVENLDTLGKVKAVDRLWILLEITYIFWFNPKKICIKSSYVIFFMGRAKWAPVAWFTFL